jgi:hypothetical protein
MAQLLTYQEFKGEIDFSDGQSSDKFNTIERTKEETYLYGLIGSALVVKIKAGSYVALLPLIKKCLSWEIYRHYVTIGNVVTGTNGTLQRKSDFSESIEYVDKTNKIKEITETLRQYESRLLQLITDNSTVYTEWNSNVATTPVNRLIITSIGE